MTANTPRVLRLGNRSVQARTTDPQLLTPLPSKVERSNAGVRKACVPAHATFCLPRLPLPLILPLRLQSVPISPPRPPTRVLRSQICDVVVVAQPSTQPAPLPDARARGVAGAIAVATMTQGSTIAAAKVARKPMAEAKPRARKGRGP